MENIKNNFFCALNSNIFKTQYIFMYFICILQFKVWCV